MPKIRIVLFCHEVVFTRIMECDWADYGLGVEEEMSFELYPGKLMFGCIWNVVDHSNLPGDFKTFFFHSQQEDLFLDLCDNLGEGKWQETDWFGFQKPPGLAAI